MAGAGMNRIPRQVPNIHQMQDLVGGKIFSSALMNISVRQNVFAIVLFAT